MARPVAGQRWTRVEAGEFGGSVFRLNDALYLKHGRGRVAGDVADEFARLRWLAGRLPVPTVCWFGWRDDEAWLLTTAFAGLTGDAWLTESPASLPMIVSAFGRFLRRVHALPVAECPFEAGHTHRLATARRRVAAGLVDTDDFDPDYHGWTAEQMLAEMVRLTPERVERCVTHGDYSVGNVLVDAGGEVTGCIDVGRMGVADPYQDIAILWQNLAEHGEAAQRLFLEGYDLVEPDMRRLEFHRCLDELF